MSPIPVIRRLSGFSCRTAAAAAMFRTQAIVVCSVHRKTYLFTDPSTIDSLLVGSRTGFCAVSSAQYRFLFLVFFLIILAQRGGRLSSSF